ncbi:MAG: phosphatidylglycerophosphatase A [Thermodesulfovibrionales bacterium]|nr:phosphatidylglycerophosphatase A [Thermodesulfovibrionales bacterium]
MTRWLIKNFSTLGPVGYFPVAPGTFGTLTAAIFLFALKPSPLWHIAITLAVVLLGIAASGEAEKILGAKDSGHIVIDEFAGYLVSMAFLPHTTGYFISSFILFRFFDILKPPPLRRLERLRGGAGVMMDDLMAGVYTNLILQIWRLSVWSL